MVSRPSSSPSPTYTSRSPSSDLNVPSSLAAFDQGTLSAVGMWPPRWDCSCGRCAGASSLPENSSGERTSIRFLLPIAAMVSSRNARIEVSCSLAWYWVAGRDTASLDSSRPSSSHFLRPPSSSLTLSWPYSLKYQYAYAANQLLLPP